MLTLSSSRERRTICRVFVSYLSFEPQVSYQSIPDTTFYDERDRLVLKTQNVVKQPLKCMAF